jgi:hypothetical protein
MITLNYVPQGGLKARLQDVRIGVFLIEQSVD